MESDREFILYNRFNGVDISSVLGQPEYSYWFVEQYFRRGIEQFAGVREISSPSEVNHSDLERSIVLSFAPPHQTPHTFAPHAVPVFAWEYASLPSEPLGGDPEWNWPMSLGKNRGAITHSEFTAGCVRRTTPSIEVASIVVPIYEKFDEFEPWTAGGAVRIDFEGAVWDSFTQERNTGRSILDIEGIVFSYVFNPFDGRKCWEQSVSAYIMAMRREADVCFVLKLIHHEEIRAVKYVEDYVKLFGPFDCRLVIMCGYLPGPSFHKLIDATTFCVNSSCGEGQCLPLLENMAAGRPALAPAHTAMMDYVNSGNSVVVEHDSMFVPFPNDPELKYRTVNFPVRWSSLFEGFVLCHQIASDSGQYKTYSDRARDGVRAVASMDVFRSRLGAFVKALKDPAENGEAR